MPAGTTCRPSSSSDRALLSSARRASSTTPERRHAASWKEEGLRHPSSTQPGPPTDPGIARATYARADHPGGRRLNHREGAPRMPSSPHWGGQTALNTLGGGGRARAI